MGVVECAKHMVVEPFPVLYEKDGEVVAQIKSTVLMMPNGPLKITGVPVDLSLYDTENKIEDEDIKVCEALHIFCCHLTYHEGYSYREYLLYFGWCICTWIVNFS